MRVSDLDIENIASRLIVTVGNYNINKDDLLSYPYVVKGDVVILCDLCIGEKNKDGLYTSCLTVTNELMNKWNINKEMLFSIAVTNGKEIMQPFVEELGLVADNEFGMNFNYVITNKYHFNGYIHAKAIPGASEVLLKRLGSLVDRLSANIELPSDDSLKLLAPDKKGDNITKIMTTVKENRSRNFTPAGQSTQMIIGATKESDLDIMNKSESMYKKYNLKRVFYSAYIPVNKDKLLPSLNIPPLKRENRLYQADWLLRYYGFKVSDILSTNNPNFNLLLDPKCDWALRHLDEFPKEINKCSYMDLLKIPGIGVTTAKRILISRKNFIISFNDLKKMGVVLKRAKYFITCNGKYFIDGNNFKKNFIEYNLYKNYEKDNFSILFAYFYLIL